MKRIIAIILSAAVMLMAGCSSVQEPVTTVPLDPETITVGDVAGTIEGDRYISHVGGVAFKLSGKYSAEWPDSDKRNILMCDYTDIDIDGPWFVWEKKASIKIDYVLDEHLKADAMKEHTLEEWNSTSKYPIKSMEYLDFTVSGKTCRGIKSVLDNNGRDVATLQLYFFQDNGLLVLFTITGINDKEVDKIVKNIQFA